MRRLYILFIFTLSAVAVQGATGAVIGDIYYTFDGTKATVALRSSNSTETEINIPSQVTYQSQTYTVTSIGNSAFSHVDIKSVTLPNSLTSIGNYSFLECTNLESITLPSSLTSIGSNAFNNCTKLTRVNVPDLSVWQRLCTYFPENNNRTLYINGSAFDHLIIDESVTDIPSGAYRGINFKTVVIGSNVKTMGNNCFTPGNILKTIWLPNVVPSANPDNGNGPSCAKGKMNYCSKDVYLNSSLFNAQDSLIKYPTLSNRFTVDGIVYVLDGTVVDVIDADYDAPPTSVTIGPTVTYRTRTFPVRYIRDYACYDSDNIVGDLHIANSEYVGSYSFYDCDNIDILTIENQDIIAPYAFANSNVNTQATVKNKGYIGSNAFENVSGGFACEIDNEGYIGQSAFAGCEMTTLKVGNNVTDILTSAFEESSISVSAFIRNNGFIGESAFANVKEYHSADINNVGYIGESAFIGNQMTTLNIGSNVKNILTSAFEGGSINESVIIRNNGYIGESAFANVKKNHSADINNVGYIGESAFIGNQMTTLNIGSNVKNILTSAFKGSTISTSATLTNNGQIYSSAFENVKGNYAADINNHGWIGQKGFKNNKFSTLLVRNDGSLGDYSFAGSTMETLTIRNSVTDLGISAFRSSSITTRADIYHTGSTGRAAFCQASGGFMANIQCAGILPDSCFYGSKMSTVTIGNAITSLGSKCFESSQFTEATIGTGVITINNRGFAQATGFQSMVLPDNVTTMQAQCFKGCTTMESISLSRGLSQINEGTFSGCTVLASIFLPKQINSIGNNVFDNCPAMSIVTFEDKDGDYNLGYSTTNTNKPLFYTAGLDSVYVGGRLKYATTSTAGYSPFRGHSKLRALRFTDKEVSIYDREFENCTALKNIFMGAGITGIGQYAFKGCTALERVKVGTGVQPMGQYSFAGCTSLKDIDLSNVVTIHNNSFDGCSALPQIRLPHTTMSVENQTFLQCTALKNLIIEDRTDTLRLGYNYNNTSYKGITGAGTPLFSDCQLDSVYIGGPIKYSQTIQDGYSPFFYNESLRTVYVTNNEKQVYQYEFYDCLNMTTIRLGEGVERIEPFGFQSCTGLLYFTFGSTLQSIGADAFSDCTNVAVITSYAKTPPTCGDQAILDINFWDCKVYVPQEAIEAYQTAEQWQDFFIYPLVEEVTGDIDGDGEIDIADIQLIINMIVGTASVTSAADINNDGEVDIADIQAIINIMLTNANAGVKKMLPKRGNEMANADFVTYEQANNIIEIRLNNDFTYSAFQMKVTLPEGVDIASVTFNPDRLEGFTKLVRNMGHGQYLIMGFSMDGSIVEGAEGDILSIRTTENRNAIISDVVFSTPEAKAYKLKTIGNQATSIKDLTMTRVWAEGNTVHVSAAQTQTMNVYSIGGSLIRKVDLNSGLNSFTLPQGQYIINSQKVFISK